MKKTALGFLTAVILGAVPVLVSALVIPVLTVSPEVVRQGQTLTLTLDPNEGSTWPTVWFVKGTSETALSSWAFPCFQRCQDDRVVSTEFQIPNTWADGSDYYAKVYDHISNQYIKTNFTVGQSDPYPTPAPEPVVTVTVSPQAVAPGQTLTISLELANGARTWPGIWFTKGTSGVAIAQTAFPCDYRCTESTTATFTIPNWKKGSDYYVNVYDETNDRYLKVSFAVKR